MSQLLNFANYNPINIDISFIEEATKQIPKQGHIEINEAESLATVFLECADRVTDEISRCSAYVGYCEAERREAKAQAIDGRITGTTGVKVAGTIATQVFGSDVDYKKSHEKLAVAEAFLDWLRTKYRNLMAAHVLCKDILKIYFSSREQGNWKTNRPHDIDDEPDYDNSSENNHSENDIDDDVEDDDKKQSKKKKSSYGADEW